MYKKTAILILLLLVTSSQAFAYRDYDPLNRFYDLNFDDIYIRIAAGNLLAFIEGAFGALIMVVAGIIAIIAAIMGNYKAALGLVVVAIGAFILRSLVSLFFGTDFPTEGMSLDDYSFLRQEVRQESPLQNYQEGAGNTF